MREEKLRVGTEWVEKEEVKTKERTNIEKPEREEREAKKSVKKERYNE
jgi:hypothetical protein